MVDVVLHVLLAVPLHPQKVIDDFNEISCVEKRVVQTVALGPTHLNIEFQPSNARQIEPSSVEEHSLQQSIGSRHRRRVTGTHLAVDLKQSVNRFGDRILFQCLGDHFTDHISLREKYLKTQNAFFDDLLELGGSQLGVGFDNDLAGLVINDVIHRKCSFEIIYRDLDPFALQPAKLSNGRFGDLLTFASNLVLLVLDVLFCMHSGKIGLAVFLYAEIEPSLFDDNLIRDIEEPQNVRISVFSVLNDLF